MPGSGSSARTDQGQLFGKPFRRHGAFQRQFLREYLHIEFLYILPELLQERVVVSSAALQMPDYFRVERLDFQKA